MTLNGALVVGEYKGRPVSLIQDHPYWHRDGHMVLKRRYEYADRFRENGKPEKEFVWPPGTKLSELHLFGWEDLKRLQPGEPIFLVEGEKTADALSKRGFIAVSLPASSMRDLRALDELFLYPGNAVIVCPDNDTAGFKAAHPWRDHLKRGHPKVRWLAPVVEEPGGDFADFLAAFGRDEDKEARAAVLEMVDTAIEEPPQPTVAEVSDEPRLVLTPLRLALDTPEPPTEWVVDGLLNKGGTSCLSGPFKGGKSTLLRIMSVAAASGMEFLGRKTSPARVGYVSLEEDRAGVKEHFRLLSDMADDQTCLDRLFFLVGDEWLPSKLDEKIDIIHECIEANALNLLVLGPLQDFFAFRNINDYSEVKPALRSFTNKVARTTGCHVIFDHHNNKYGSGRAAFLGSVAIGGGVDQLLTLTVVEDENGQVNGRGLTTWQRYGESLLNLLGLDFLPNRLDAHLGPPPERLRDQAGLQQLAVKITAMCHTWTEARTIEAEIGGNKERRISATNLAVDQGMLARRPKKGRGGGYEYLDAQYLDSDPGTGSGTGSEGNEE